MVSKKYCDPAKEYKTTKSGLVQEYSEKAMNRKYPFFQFQGVIARALSMGIKISTLAAVVTSQ